MPDSEKGAQRASARKLRTALTGVFAALVIVTGMSATAPHAQAASQKVVIVVGPVGSATDDYKHGARKLADKARSYGAHVVEIFSPYATWSRVHDAAQGANILIYLGHGNGWPSPYHPFMDTSKDGMGLNASSGHGNSNTKYYGEYYMERLGLASHSVVLTQPPVLRLGQQRVGRRQPDPQGRRKKRVDNYGYGFIKGGAQAVFASGITDVGYVLKGLFTGSKGMSMSDLFWTDPTRTVRYKVSFDSRRINGVSARMDPYKAHRYYRSVVGRLNTTVGDWRSG